MISRRQKNMCLSAVGIVASELFVPDLDPAKMKEKRNFNFFLILVMKILDCTAVL